MSLFMELVAPHCHYSWRWWHNYVIIHGVGSTVLSLLMAIGVRVCVCVWWGGGGGGGLVGNFSDDSEQCGTTQYLEYFACMHTHALPENALTAHGHMSILLHNYTQFQLAPRSSLGRNRTGGEGWVWRGVGWGLRLCDVICLPPGHVTRMSTRKWQGAGDIAISRRRKKFPENRGKNGSSPSLRPSRCTTAKYCVTGANCKGVIFLTTS